MKSRIFIVLSALVIATLACSAPGAPEEGSATLPVVTVVVTSEGATQPGPTDVPQATAPQGITCSVVQDVRVHTCAGATSASVVGSSPAGSTFTPTKWDGQNWYYGQVPTTGGPAWGWVSRLNSDGSTLVACQGDMSALPKSYEPCPTPVPTSTNTPVPPTDTPQPTATNTIAPNLCGNGVADTGESCGEPVFLACSAGKVCKSCKCQFLILQLTPIIVSP